jgi:hypothetical protein
MKAHVVKGYIFDLVFLLAACFCVAVAGAAGWTTRVLSSPSCGFSLFVPGLARDVVSS